MASSVACWIHGAPFVFGMAATEARNVATHALCDLGSGSTWSNISAPLDAHDGCVSDASATIQLGAS